MDLQTLKERFGEYIETIFMLMATEADKTTRHRLNKFITWARGCGVKLYEPALDAYCDYLLAQDHKKPSTVRAHLSTVRAGYRRLVQDNQTRDYLYHLTTQVMNNAVEQKAFVDETITRMENAINPASSQVKVITSQDRPDADFLRLTREQAEALMNAPGQDTRAGLRDTAIIALMLCTGIREAELVVLDVPDLRQKLGGELALHVRKGKGNKERLIPYGALAWVLVIVEAWLQSAGIEGGAVYRGLYKGGYQLRPGRLSVRAVQCIVTRYPVVVDGELRKVKPHDLRRTYARRLYEAGVNPLAIMENLGHGDLKTTLAYIGTLDANRRRAPAVYSFNLEGLLRQAELGL